MYPFTRTLANSDPVSTAGRRDYAANAGDFYAEFPFQPQDAGPAGLADADDVAWRTENTANAEVIEVRLNGISFQRSRVAIRQVTDGTSNTYLAGEKRILATE